MTTIERPRTATDPLLEQLGLRPVINVAGSVSRLGGTTLAPEVREAMVAAATSFIPMVELQAWASEAIADATGAEAGCVASGAAACLFLAAAASIARFDPGVDGPAARHDGHPQRDRGPPRAPQPVRPRAARGRRAVRRVRVPGPGESGNTALADGIRVIGDRTAAVFYPGAKTAGVLPLRDVAEVAHAHGLPVIVDAAEMVPPASNLRRFIDEGADLVAFSGGKAVGGPAASGFLAGRRDLILSATAQQQDMYVRPTSWPGPHGGGSRDMLPEPPQQPVGRIVKVGREEVVGLVVALRRYAGLDHAAQAARWRALAERIRSAVDGAGGSSARIEAEDEAHVPSSRSRCRAASVPRCA